MSGQDWNKEEIGYLKRYYPKMSLEKISVKLGRSKNSIVSKAQKMGIKSSYARRWEKWEDRYLIRHYSKNKPESIGRTLKRSKAAVIHRAKVLKLTGTRGEVWTKEEKDFLQKSYPDRSIPLEKIASHLNRSITAIRSYANRLKVVRPAHDHQWTKAEHEYLVKNYKTKQFKDIAADLGLSRWAVTLHANKSGIFRKSKLRRWTEDDIEFVRKNYAELTAEEIGVKLGRSVQSVRQCAGRLGLQGRHNWYKPANVEARVRKFKAWYSQKNKNSN